MIKFERIEPKNVLLFAFSSFVKTVDKKKFVLSQSTIFCAMEFSSIYVKKKIWNFQYINMI